MQDGQDFVDFYGLLQVDPNCEDKVIDVAYHHFAKLYHPDHAETADVAKFSAVTEAYKTLKNPEKRAEFNRLYELHKGDQAPNGTIGGIEVNGKTALDDAEIHEKILHILYKKRRENAKDAGVVGWLLQETLECSEEHFDFHFWYLKSKGYLELTEQGTLAITIEGVDHVISRSRSEEVEKLLLSKADTPDD
jgi:curved DNA-binding protein